MVSVTEAYIALTVVSAPFIVASLYHVLNNVRRRGSRALAVLLTGTLVWLVSALTVELAPTFQVGLYANRIQYVGIVAVPTAFFLFALAYVDRGELVNRYSVGLLAIEPLAVLGLVWTNRQHALWTAGGVVPEGSTYVVDGAAVTCRAVICFGDSGVGFLAHTVYSYVLLLLGAILVLARPLRSSAIPRGQATSMAVAVGAPFGTNVLSIFALPAAFPDLTPVAFGVTGVAMVVGLYRYSLVETNALMGEASVGEREGGAVLVDDDDEVSDLNVEAARVLGVDADTALGASVEEVFAEHEALLAGHRQDGSSVDGLVLKTPISGEEVAVRSSEVSPGGTSKSGSLYEFSQQE